MNNTTINNQISFQAKLRIGDTGKMLSNTQKSYLTEYARKIGTPTDTIDMAFASINGITTLFLQSFINGVKKDITYRNLGNYPIVAGMHALYKLEKSFKI